MKSAKRVSLGLVLGAAASLAIVGSAGAVQQAKSRYSTIDLAKCRSTTGFADGKSWRCTGLPGYPVYVATHSTKTFLSAGKDAEVRRAASQTLAAQNSLFERSSQRTAVEWRFVIRNKQVVPYAMIVRYFTRDNSRRGEVLVVTRVTERDACQIARIDALATADAMVLARRIADEQARRFDCTAPPAVAGEVGRSPM